MKVNYMIKCETGDMNYNRHGYIVVINVSLIRICDGSAIKNYTGLRLGVVISLYLINCVIMCLLPYVWFYIY